MRPLQSGACTCTCACTDNWQDTQSHAAHRALGACLNVVVRPPLGAQHLNRQGGFFQLGSQRLAARLERRDGCAVVGLPLSLRLLSIIHRRKSEKACAVCLWRLFMWFNAMSRRRLQGYTRWLQQQRARQVLKHCASSRRLTAAAARRALSRRSRAPSASARARPSAAPASARRSRSTSERSSWGAGARVCCALIHSNARCSNCQ